MYSCPRDCHLLESCGNNWEPSWNLPVYHSTIVLRVLRGPCIGASWCRETLVSSRGVPKVKCLGKNTKKLFCKFLQKFNHPISTYVPISVHMLCTYIFNICIAIYKNDNANYVCNYFVILQNIVLKIVSGITRE